MSICNGFCMWEAAVSVWASFSSPPIWNFERKTQWRVAEWNRFCLFSSFHLQKLLFLLQHASLGSGLSSLYALLNCFDCVFLCPSIKTFRSSDSLTWRQRVGLPSTKWLICNFPILSCIGFLFFGILNSNFIFVLDKEMKLEERGKELKVGE